MIRALLDRHAAAHATSLRRALTKCEGSPVAAATARRSTQFGFFFNSMELEFSARVYVLPPGRLTK
jgi:hypothetical protein